MVSRPSLRGRALEVLADADVVVAGGGPAGLGAALASARQGARTVLLERYGFLGGNFTAASVGTICGLYRRGDGDWTYVTRGLAAEFAEGLGERGAAHGPVPFKDTAVMLYVPWEAKRLADHLVTEQDGLEVLLHSFLCDVVVEDETVQAVVLATKQGLRAVTARAFVDCTGDADLCHFAGAPTRLGPPGLRQHASMQFVLQHVDDPEAMAQLGRLSEHIAEHGQHLSRDGGATIPTMRPGEFIGAMTRVTNPDGTPIDVTDPRQATWGEMEGRRLAEEAAEFLRRHVPGFGESFLADTAAQLGVRETRRIEGEYVLTGDDVVDLARFDDAVAAGSWPQEFHVAGKSTEYRFLPDGAYYQVPLRSLRPSGLRNVLAAGRCISADHEALASTRVMGPSLALGQAAGTTAALAARSSSPTTGVEAAEVRQELAAAGAFLG